MRRIYSYILQPVPWHFGCYVLMDMMFLQVLCDLVTVWFAMKLTSTFLLHVFLFFLFFFQPTIVDLVKCEQCICVLFTVPQITLFSSFFIKNGSHNTIYTFKNYFATVFSVSAKISSIQTHP